MKKNNFGERLKFERNRLGLSQEAFSAVGGVKKLAQLSYEQGRTVPDIGFMRAVSDIGVDVMYVISGTPATAMLSEDESQLVDKYRKLDTTSRSRLQGLVEGLLAGAHPDSSKK